ncbi:MAG: helix-turn-helix transcriptional regulator [Gammaproteobacteria bacterium]|nr:helix-turn-helix transcriptional regulator [Gammaproteobacteria bacterium]
MSEDDLKKFGCRLRNIRSEKGISQEELASLAGVHRTYIGGIERGERNVSLRNIFAISHALGIETTELFGDS